MAKDRQVDEGQTTFVQPQEEGRAAAQSQPPHHQAAARVCVHQTVWRLLRLAGAGVFAHQDQDQDLPRKCSELPLSVPPTGMNSA